MIESTVTAKAAGTEPSLVVVGLVFLEVSVPPVSVKLGEEVFVPEIRLGIGGAANVAAVASALGISVVLHHPAGSGPAARAVEEILGSARFRRCTFGTADQAPISLVMAKDGDRSFITAARHEALDECPPLPPTRWVHVPGLAEARHLEMRLAEAKQRGATVSVSAAWVPDELERLASERGHPFDVLFMNEREAVRAAGSLETALERLSGAARDVIITRGPRGAFGLCDGEAFESPAAPAEVIDATGAGDAFAAGFIAARLGGEGGKDAATIGARAAAQIVQTRGGFVTDPLQLGEVGRFR